MFFQSLILLIFHIHYIFLVLFDILFYLHQFIHNILIQKLIFNLLSTELSSSICIMYSSLNPLIKSYSLIIFLSSLMYFLLFFFPFYY